MRLACLLVLALLACNAGAQPPAPESRPAPQSRPASPAPPDLNRIAGGKYKHRARGRAALRPVAAGVAIERGLQWLARHQDADGRWNGDEFMKLDKVPPFCDGAGGSAHDVGLTGLALLAFLADGHTPHSGVHAPAVARGVAWLVRQQAKDGLLGKKDSHDFAYGHAIATLALCEAYGLGNDPELAAPARAAVGYIERARNVNAAWRYYPRDGDNDTSITHWFVMALVAARDFGLDVSAEPFAHTLAYIDSVTEPETGKVGYTKPGERSARTKEMVERFPATKTEALTAAALTVRIMLGQNPKKTPTMVLAADLVRSMPPLWQGGSIDHYYWCHGSTALHQCGGNHWSDWSRALYAQVLPQQRKDGNFAGSWDAADAWGNVGGRIYSTAILVLALTSEYRFARILEPGWRGKR